LAIFLVHPTNRTEPTESRHRAAQTANASDCDKPGLQFRGQPG
jgi:hypothetical protein